MYSTICITGACGFIGSHMVKYFADKGNFVIKLDKKNEWDILDDQLISKIQQFDTLIHLAANTFVPDSYKDPVKFFKYNYLLTMSALELCRKFKAHFIYFSSYVYGKPKYIPIDENHPVDGFNPYANSKLICEELCRAYNRHFQIPLSIIRPFNIYGPGQDARFLIPKILKMAREGHVMLDNPLPRRDYIYIDDVLSFIGLLTLNLDRSYFDIYNLGSGSDYSVEEVVSLINNEINFSLCYTNNNRINEIELTVCDISKAKKMFDWNPETSMKQGLRKIINGS